MKQRTHDRVYPYEHAYNAQSTYLLYSSVLSSNTAHNTRSEKSYDVTSHALQVSQCHSIHEQ